MLSRDGGELCVDGLRLCDIAAEFGTPAYIYSWPAIEARYREMEAALAVVRGQIRYAVKANGSLAILSRLAGLGAGFDIVSGGELERVMRSGGSPAKVVFSGVGKSTVEIDFAIKAGIECFNVESASELSRIEARARLLGRRAPVSVRVNPDVDPGTHPYIATGLKHSKFGVPASVALDLYTRAAESDALSVVGIDCHIGSQITAAAPFAMALERLLELAGRLAGQGINVRHIDIGGGFGVCYRDEQPFDLKGFADTLAPQLASTDLTVLVEPGRSLVADAGILLTRIEYLKATGERQFAVVDAAMNDLIRPALYDAWHGVEKVGNGAGERALWDIVGPVCESGDFLAHERDLELAEGDLLAIRSAGAYGFSQSSNYNTRPRPPEILVEDGQTTLVRRRESTADLFRLECL
ncbi:MAG: diaminopimelate decarboxylase [Gammaproteobacteria bacterium]|nr:diaminopimelate decarboxylase [Gammaproteobacteria bacterium]